LRLGSAAHFTSSMRSVRKAPRQITTEALTSTHRARTPVPPTLASRHITQARRAPRNRRSDGGYEPPTIISAVSAVIPHPTTALRYPGAPPSSPRPGGAFLLTHHRLFVGDLWGRSKKQRTPLWFASGVLVHWDCQNSAVPDALTPFPRIPPRVLARSPSLQIETDSGQL
jgi:hypothetical protein